VLCVIRKALISWSSSRPLSGETGIVSNIYNKPPTQRLEYRSRKTSPPLLPYFQATYRRPTRMLAKRDIQSVDRSPRKISSFLRTVTEELGLRIWGVYSIHCECGHVYIGRTGRSTETIKKDYCRYLRLGYPAKSAVAEREFSRDHLIKFQDPRILFCIRLHGPTFQGGS